MRSGLISALALAVSAAGSQGLPNCSTKQSGPCRCPDGTQYAESATFTVIGAAAKDVEALVNDFFNPDWLGARPWKTQGRNNAPGAIRTTEFPTPIGVYNMTEKLTEHDVRRDYSFIQRFEQLASTIPVPYKDGSGSFSGIWVTIEGTNIFDRETHIRWSNYACETGHARNFARFHENALKNATSVLTAAGKVTGLNGGPWSVQNF